MDELTWLQQGESMLRQTSSLKGVLMSRQRSFSRDTGISLTERNKVATQLLSHDRGFKTNAKKSCRDITNWVVT